MVAERGVGPPQEQIPERTCEQVVDVRMTQVVGQVLEVPESQAKTEKCMVQWSRFLMSLCWRWSKIGGSAGDRFPRRSPAADCEQIVDAPVLQAVEELAEVSKVFSQDRIQQRIVEQTIPAIPLAEKIVELPVIQTRQGVNTHAQHVVDTVEVEKSKVITQTGQKPIIQEKIKPVTKHVEVPLSQFTGKAMNMPVVAQRQIPMDQTVQKTMEISQLQCVDEVIDVPAVFVEQVPHVHVVAKTQRSHSLTDP